MSSESTAERMRAFQRRWTVAAGPAPASTGPERVIAVPLHLPLADGFAAARRLLDGEGSFSGPDRPVRLIALNATVREGWPEWVMRAQRPLLLTEIDAYFPRDKAARVAALYSPIERWLDAILDGVVPGARASRLFWATALERLFAEHVNTFLLLETIVAFHATDELTILDNEWARAFAPATGSSRQRTSRAPALLPLAVAALEGAAIAQRVREWLREAPARARVARERTAESPRRWVTIVAHWPRASRPVPEMLGPSARARGERLGVLLQSAVRPGLWTTPFERDVDPHPILPVLDDEALAGTIATVDQGISAESPRALASVIAGAIATTARATVRAMRTPLSFGASPAIVPLRLPLLHFAKLLTVDVLRAREAAHAAAAFTARHVLDGAVVTMPHATSVNDAVLELHLRRAGATTIELVHGTTEIAHALGPGRTSTTVKLFWTAPEAAALAPFLAGQRCLGGFYPRRRRPLPARPRPSRAPGAAPIIILAASSYLIRGWGWDPRLNLHYQVPFLDEVAKLATLRWPIRLRWRPHPGDDADSVARYLARYPMLERSTASAEQDLTEAQILVTSPSSLALEALFTGLPVFVHDVPRWDDSATTVFAPARRFGVDRSLLELIAPLLEALAAGDPSALAPERALAERLFGPGGQPASVDDVVWSTDATTGVRLCARSI